MLNCELDHLVVTAATLHDGVEYVRRALGVTPQMGGKHQLMGTHNCLIRLGYSTYLEVIAVDPSAPLPSRPRWFELDGLRADDPPRLATWVARVNDLRAATAASPVPLGEIEPMSRGHLNWQITIPADGRLLYHGVSPMLIQWAPGPHPASQLDDAGCSLVGLQGFHSDPRQITAMLSAVGFHGDFVAAPISNQWNPYLAAMIQTPGGLRRLGAA